MAYTIRKTFQFSASHRLEGLPPGHKCGRLHGHNYRVTVELVGVRLDGAGMVLDYGKLAPFQEWLDANLDHRHLNDVLGTQPVPLTATAEHLAMFLCGRAQTLLGDLPPGTRVAAVQVEETPNTWAEYRP